MSAHACCTPFYYIVVLCSLVKKTKTVTDIHTYILGIRMRIRCLTRSTWKVRNGDRSSKRWRRAVLRLPVHESASEANRSGGDTQVVSCHRYLIVFHPFVEQLTVFHTSGLVLASSSIFRVLDLDLHSIARWHPERHVPKGT